MRPVPPYLAPIDLPPVSRPSAAFADLRAFLASREKHQWVFALLSVLITCYFIAFFLVQSQTKEYKPPEIIGLQNYAANRTDAQSKAQQRIEQVKSRAEQSELKQLQESQRRESDKLQKKLGELGI